MSVCLSIPCHSKHCTNTIYSPVFAPILMPKVSMDYMSLSHSFKTVLAEFELQIKKN